MNGVIITTALREKECAEALRRHLQFTPKPRAIILVHCPGRPEFDVPWPEALAEKNPEVIFLKTKPGATTGLTGAWNYGFRKALELGCDAIVCVNDDVYVNDTWPTFFETIRNHPRAAMFGPVSKRPGVDYTRVQTQPCADDTQWIFTQEQPAGSKQEMYFCVNGFCFGLSGSVSSDLAQVYGEVLDAAGYPWGGQEEDLGRRIQGMGGELVVDGRTYVDHLKFSDWRKHNLKNREW